jgi:hypothetical protein
MLPGGMTSPSKLDVVCFATTVIRGRTLGGKGVTTTKEIWSVARGRQRMTMPAKSGENQARRLSDIFDVLQPEQWNLTMIRDGGTDGVYEFTVAGLASYAVHEAHHHLLDADGSLPPTITATPR